MKILVVDDEHILRTRLKSVLEQSGLPLSAVFTAENALNAIECIEKEQPQIVITDIRMPIMSGLELATHIHTHYPQIKVILVTGYSDFEYARTAIQNNVFEYLLKPIDSENLIAVILRAQKEIESAEKNERLFKVFKEHFSDNLQSARRQFVENLLFRSGVFQNADDLREAYAGSISKPIASFPCAAVPPWMPHSLKVNITAHTLSMSICRKRSPASSPTFSAIWSSCSGT